MMRADISLMLHAFRQAQRRAVTRRLMLIRHAAMLSDATLPLRAALPMMF